MKAVLVFMFVMAAQFQVGQRGMSHGVPSGCSTYSDGFVTPGALSASWSIVSAGGYTSVNQGSGFAQSNPTGTKGWAIYTAAPSGSNQCSQMTINLGSNLNAIGSTGPTVLSNSSGNGYVWPISSTDIYLVTAGSGVSAIATGCPNTNNGDRVQLTVIASTHTFTCTDITSGFSATGTDSTYTAGFPGMLIDQASVAVHMSSWSGQ